MNLIVEAVKILSERQIAFADRFIPFFMSSYGLHRLNLVNRGVSVPGKKPIYEFQQRLPDLRMQILFTAPPGWSKSLFLKNLLTKKYGICYTADIPLRFMGSCTEAAWTGSVDGTGSGATECIGIAKKFSNGIVGIEEFAAIQEVLKQQHSAHLEQSLAKSLFGGDVQKDLKNIEINYHTDITCWGGNQTLKFRLGGGLFRRFFHVFWVPRISDAEIIADKIWEGDNVRLDAPRLNNFRIELDNFNKEIENVESIKFDPSLRKRLLGLVHFEQLLYKNFALGYTIMTYGADIPRNINVKLTPDLDLYLAKALEWRRQLLADPSGYQVQCLIYDLMERTGESEIKINLIRDTNLLFSTDYDTTHRILDRLSRHGIIRQNRGEGTVKFA
jgi:hypothetical protein